MWRKSVNGVVVLTALVVDVVNISKIKDEILKLLIWIRLGNLKLSKEYYVGIKLTYNNILTHELH